MSKGVATEATIGSEGMGVGDLATTREKISKFVSRCDGGERRIRERTNGIAGMESVGSGGRFTKGEQKVEPLKASHSANKGEVSGESCARFVIQQNDGSRRTNK